MIQNRVHELSQRSENLLLALGKCGPLSYRQLLRLQPVLLPDLTGTATLKRLLYRELSFLTARNLAATRRPPRSNAAVWFLTRKGAARLEARDHGEFDDDNFDGYFARPAHEGALRSLIVEVWRAKGLPDSPVRGLDWSFKERFLLVSEIGDQVGEYRPDAVLWFTLKSGAELNCMAEVDCGTETQGRWREKMALVGPLLEEFGDTCRLLVITTGKKQRLLNMVQSAREVMGSIALLHTRWIVAPTVDSDLFFTASFNCPSTENTGGIKPVMLFDW